MRKSTAILATVALGAVLTIGSATASMARDAGNGGHGGGSGRGFSGDRASAGDHAYGATVPFITNNGDRTSSYHGFSFRHGVNDSRHFGGFGNGYFGGFGGRDLSDRYAYGPLFGFDPYLGY